MERETTDAGNLILRYLSASAVYYIAIVSISSFGLFNASSLSLIKFILTFAWAFYIAWPSVLLKVWEWLKQIWN